MAVINLRETIDPVLAEHYPGLGMRVLVSKVRDGYDVTLADGRCIEVDARSAPRRAASTRRTAPCPTMDRPCDETFETADPQDPIRCDLRGPHKVHKGSVSWGGL